MLNGYDYLSQQLQDRREQFLKEAEQDALKKVAREANSASANKYNQTIRLGLRQRLGLLRVSQG